MTPAVTLASNPSGFPIAITKLAHSQILGIGQAHVSQLWRIDSNNGKVRIRVVACQLGGIFAAVRQVNGDCACVMNNVAVRQNESIRRDHEPGSVSAEFALSTSCADPLFYVDITTVARRARLR
jgi:hypothetical protein